MSANVLIILGTIVVPSVVILCVCVITFVNLYLKIRRRFPAKVNCWFCNTDTRVPFDQANSFVCPACHQYNGFTADGDYNREIPEQYQQRPNSYCYHPPGNVTDDDKWGSSARSIAAGSISTTTRNGLCFGCNRNQELKIHQLASFVPDDEDNYDAEVEDYRKQLEHAYKLCGRCERVLKRTLNDVKRNILGSKLAQIGSKSLKVLDMHMTACTKQLAHLKRQRWVKVSVYAMSGLLLMKLSQELSESGWTVAELMLFCPPSLLSTIKVIISYALALKQLIWEHWDRLLSEPAVQHTTERVEQFGNELFQRYGPQMLQCSAPLFEPFTERVVPIAPLVGSPSFLLNGAIISLAALLASLGSQRTAIKQMLIIALCATDCLLKYLQYENLSNYHLALLLTLAALGLAASCIGQRVIRTDVARGNDMNSSFHKIYSQQCSESDYSDVDTTANCDQSPVASFKLNCSSSRPFGQNTKHSLWNEALLAPTLLTGKDEHRADVSRKSLDTTKSASPTSLSISPTNSFFMKSYAANNSKISGSLFNVAEADELQLNATRSVFGPAGTAPPPGSLLKAPSFSVDDFQASSKRHPAPWKQRKSDTPSMASARSKQFRYSMSTLGHQDAPNVFREEDPLIEDDIDRLSISGRVSMNASMRAHADQTGSRVSLLNGNPFAQVNATRNELDYDEISSATLRQRRLLPPRPETLAATKESLWSGFLATGPGGQSAHMSRTSSQSSGFESQVETTRRNTPTEPDVLSVYTTPELVPSDPSKTPPSPVPSSASVFHNQRLGGNSTTTASQVRSLFGEQNLFNHALQQKPASSRRDGPSGLFFPQYNYHGMAVNGGGASSTASSAFHRHIFPPQQSQTPSSFHHHHPPSLQLNHPLAGNGGGGGSSLSLNGLPLATSTFGTPKAVSPDRTSHHTPSVAGTSFYTSNRSTAASGRASLLNLSKINHELNSGTLPTA